MKYYEWFFEVAKLQKLAWVGFELTSTEFCSDTLSDWAIRPWVQLARRVNFLQLLQFHRLYSIRFYFRELPSSFAKSILIKIFLYIFICIYMYCRIVDNLVWLAHLVNTKVVVDASSNPPVSRVKLL